MGLVRLCLSSALKTTRKFIQPQDTAVSRHCPTPWPSPSLLPPFYVSLCLTGMVTTKVGVEFCSNFILGLGVFVLAPGVGIQPTCAAQATCAVQCPLEPYQRNPRIQSQDSLKEISPEGILNMIKPIAQRDFHYCSSESCRKLLSWHSLPFQYLTGTYWGLF